MMELEQADRRLLIAMQKRGRISNQELAEATGMSPSSCWRRVRALEDAGIIRHYATILNPEACGLDFHAILHVVLARHKPDTQAGFVSAIRARREVLDCFSTTGDADYHLRVRCANKAAYNRFLEDFLFGLPGVSTVRTNLVLREIKHENAIPLD